MIQISHIYCCMHFIIMKYRRDVYHMFSVEQPSCKCQNDVYLYHHELEMLTFFVAILCCCKMSFVVVFQ